MPEDFKVKVGEIEGPLELILELIEKKKLHISDVSLSQVADEFIEYIKSFEEFPMSDSADFILVASTLLLIKSKSLLPNLALTEEEQGSIEDLEQRLELYRKYRDISFLVAKIFGHTPLYFREEKKNQHVIFTPTKEINLKVISQTMAEILNNIPRDETKPQVKIKRMISLEEMIESLRERVENNIRINFSDFAGKNKSDKVAVIVGFLAMLELIKRGILRVEQEKHFEEIRLEPEKINTPTY